MLESFIFVNNDKIDSIDGCGMKLSSWADRHVLINGERKSFISSLLNPRDNLDKYKSLDFKLVKIEIDIDYCYVAEGFLLNRTLSSLNDENILYTKTIIPAKNYFFGMYRQPECLIGKTILPNEMKIPSKALSFPLFYESSSRIYLDKIIEGLREENPNFDDFVLNYYYDYLAQNGKMEKVTDDKDGIIAYLSKDIKAPIVLKHIVQYIQEKQEELIEG